MDPGPCDALNTAYYYNTFTGTCHSFNYGGCEGNMNRFDSWPECMEACAEDYEYPILVNEDED